jgi:hypothetical protein
VDWIHPEDLDEKIGKNMVFVVVPSRNNMKPKEGKSVRPRFYVYFPHDSVTDGEARAALKKAIQQKYRDKIVHQLQEKLFQVMQSYTKLSCDNAQKLYNDFLHIPQKTHKISTFRPPKHTLQIRTLF